VCCTNISFHHATPLLNGHAWLIIDLINSTCGWHFFPTFSSLFVLSIFPVKIFYLHNTQCARRKYVRLCVCLWMTESENICDLDAWTVTRWWITFGDINGIYF
jgi:hypothetical protein